MVAETEAEKERERRLNSRYEAEPGLNLSPLVPGLTLPILLLLSLLAARGESTTAAVVSVRCNQTGHCGRVRLYCFF